MIHSYVAVVVSSYQADDHPPTAQHGIRWAFVCPSGDGQGYGYGSRQEATDAHIEHNLTHHGHDF